jgi:hypothetical protein
LFLFDSWQLVLFDCIKVGEEVNIKFCERKKME